jgi:hypothetical protein
MRFCTVFANVPGSRQPFHYGGENLFCQIEEITAVAIGRGNQCLARDHQRQRPFENSARAASAFHGIGIEAVQHKNLGTRQERPVQFEGGFSWWPPPERWCRPRHGAGRNPAGFVEAVNFIDEEQRAPALFAADARSLENLSSDRRHRKNRRHLLEDEAGFAASSRAMVVLPVPGGPRRRSRPGGPRPACG